MHAVRTGSPKRHDAGSVIGDLDEHSPLVAQRVQRDGLALHGFLESSSRGSGSPPRAGVRPARIRPRCPSKPSNITVRNNLFFIVSPNFGNGSSGLSAFRRTKTAPICKNKKLLRKTTDRTSESLRVAGKSVANAPRPARSATPLGTENSRFFPGNGRPARPENRGTRAGCRSDRPKPPPVKAALLGIPKNVIFARVIL